MTHTSPKPAQPGRAPTSLSPSPPVGYSMVEVRPATPDDAAAIRRVAEAAYRATYVDIVGADGVERLLAAWYDPEDLSERLAAEDGATTYVAVDGEVVGYAGAVVPESENGESDRVGHLPTLYVHPDRWGEGIGGRLFDRAREHVAARGGTAMRIRVFAENDVGRRFYEDRATLLGEEEDDLAPLKRSARTAVYEAPVRQ